MIDRSLLSGNFAHSIQLNSSQNIILFFVLVDMDARVILLLYFLFRHLNAFAEPVDFGRLFDAVFTAGCQFDGIDYVIIFLLLLLDEAWWACEGRRLGCFLLGDVAVVAVGHVVGVPVGFPWSFHVA